MSYVPVIAARPGLVAGDFNFELYLSGVAEDASALTVTERTVDATVSYYFVNGIDDPAPGEFWSLTFDDGIQTGVRRWPDSTSTPQNFVLPFRQAGVVLDDLDGHLYLDGAEVDLDSYSVTLTDLGDPHDYLLENVPAPPAGSVFSFGYLFGSIYTLVSWPQLVAGVNTALTTECDLIESLLSLMPDTFYAQPGVLNKYSVFVPSGAMLSLPCKIEGSTRIVRDVTGRDVPSTVQIIVGGAYGLTVHAHRYALPSRFAQNESIEAIAIVKETDEMGPCYEEVMLP